MNKYLYTPGVCAHCGSDKIIYLDPIIKDYLVSPYECESCHAKGKEIYDLDFVHNREEA